MISNFELAVADLIVQKRRDLGLTQAYVNDALGFEGGYIGKIESHIKGANLDHINMLAKIFNCSPRELIPETHIEERR
jgi:transcriptional regulator with XRE-family HTH domain